ncbi:MAG: hypothetical protein EOP83_06550 [Verrucomicrobiaceae bacterium]|nr:MAG: hypothetical protein EOP83_06550 [Verrucomicrobiaceae bacterium]
MRFVDPIHRTEYEKVPLPDGNIPGLRMYARIQHDRDRDRLKIDLDGPHAEWAQLDPVFSEVERAAMQWVMTGSMIRLPDGSHAVFER